MGNSRVVRIVRLGVFREGLGQPLNLLPPVLT
jgi:hypothetical protein